MRLHRQHLVLRPWSLGEPVLDPVRLVALRVEPVLLFREGVVAIDAVLEDGDALTVIPSILLDRGALADRDRDPLIFPDGTPGGDAFGVALAERIVPLLERDVLDGVPLRARAVVLVPSPRFEAARAAGCYGAAPLDASLLALAPYRAARRFARRRRVAIDARDAVAGWAVLRDVAEPGVATERRDPAAIAWYGDPPAAPAEPDLAIVEGDAASPARWTVRLRAAGEPGMGLVAPVPLDVPFSNDPAEGVVRAALDVAPPAPPPSHAADFAYVATGGSGGRIALLAGRSDLERLPADDADELTALAAALAAEGFDVAQEESELARCDLVHVVGTREGARVERIVRAAREAGVPVAITAHDDAPERGGWWGAAVARMCFEHGRDEGALRSYLALLARRGVSLGAVTAGTPYAPPAAGAAARLAALREADVVFVHDAAEADDLRAAGRERPIHVVAPVLCGEAPAPPWAVVGAEPYLLLHAPIGPAANQLLVARVAAELALPLVVAGPVQDASYLERVRQFGGPDLVVLPGEPDPATARGLRGGAAVAVDAAWAGWGAARIAAALADGAWAAAAERRRLPADEALRRFDPADAASLSRALGEAWDGALSGRRPRPDLLERLRPSRAVREIVAGYALAAGVA